MANNQKQVVYYPGCFTNYWAPECGRAVVRILEENGVRVVVPNHRCCGIARVGYGDFNGARKEAVMLTNELSPLVERGYDVLTDCPSCCLAIKEEYPSLLNSEKVKSLSERTHFWSRWLYRSYQKGEFNASFNRMSALIAYHAPCHLKAQGLEGDSVRLMGLIPELRIINLDRGCCGMGGTAGFKRRYYDSSMAIGGPLWQRIEEIDAQLVATDCGGCRIQIEHAAKVKVVHPAVVLNEAYRHP